VDGKHHTNMPPASQCATVTLQNGASSPGLRENAPYRILSAQIPTYSEEYTDSELEIIHPSILERYQHPMLGFMHHEYPPSEMEDYYSGLFGAEPVELVQVAGSLRSEPVVKHALEEEAPNEGTKTPSSSKDPAGTDSQSAGKSMLTRTSSSDENNENYKKDERRGKSAESLYEFPRVKTTPSPDSPTPFANSESRNEEEAENPCDCVVDVAARAARLSGRIGCFQTFDILTREPDDVCYVKGKDCPGVLESRVYPGLYWRHCDRRLEPSYSENGSASHSQKTSSLGRAESPTVCSECTVEGGILRFCQPSCSGSRKIQLRDKGIMLIGKDAFRGMSSIEEVDVSENKIEMIEEGALDTVPNLKKLLIYSNPITMAAEGIRDGIKFASEYPGFPRQLFDNLDPTTQIFFQKCCWYSAAAVSGFLRSYQDVAVPVG